MPDLRGFPAPALTPVDCACATQVCPGWESVSQPLAPPLVRRVGTLRAAGDEEPGFEEWTAADGARVTYWSPQAPIAPGFFPYNRCDVWACATCGRGFLQYTEFGGYYVDHRLRQIDPARVV